MLTCCKNGYEAIKKARCIPTKKKYGNLIICALKDFPILKNFISIDMNRRSWEDRISFKTADALN